MDDIAMIPLHWIFYTLVVVALVGVVRRVNWAAEAVLTPIVLFVGSAVLAGTGIVSSAGGMYGFCILWMLGVTASVLMRKNKTQQIADGQAVDGFKKCPACAEVIRSEAAKCRFCGTEQPA